MSPSEERKLIREVLKNIDSPRRALPLPALLMELLAMAGIVLVAVWVARQPGEPNWQTVLFLATSFASGAVIGFISLWRAFHRRDTLIQPYIDQQRLQARLSELEA